MSNLINIKTFMTRYEAEIAKGLLKEQGIEAMISADDCGGFRSHLSLGNVQLLVSEECVEKAKEILQVLGKE